MNVLRIMILGLGLLTYLPAVAQDPKSKQPPTATAKEADSIILQGEVQVEKGKKSILEPILTATAVTDPPVIHDKDSYSFIVTVKHEKPPPPRRAADFIDVEVVITGWPTGDKLFQPVLRQTLSPGEAKPFQFLIFSGPTGGRITYTFRAVTRSSSSASGAGNVQTRTASTNVQPRPEPVRAVALQPPPVAFQVAGTSWQSAPLQFHFDASGSLRFVESIADWPQDGQGVWSQTGNSVSLKFRRRCAADPAHFSDVTIQTQVSGNQMTGTWHIVTHIGAVGGQPGYSRTSTPGFSAILMGRRP